MRATAHNEVDRHTFLVLMREVAPGLCKLLEFVYPTGVATDVFCWGRVVPSAAGGQQGCPLIGACPCTGEAHGARELGLRGSSGTLPDTSTRSSWTLRPHLRMMASSRDTNGRFFAPIQHMKRGAGRFRAFRDEGCVEALDGKFEMLKSPIGDQLS